MKVALACNGEGFGHVARTVTFYESLKDEYELIILAPRTVHDFLAEKIPEAEVREVPHMHLVKIRDRIDILKTLRENLPTLLILRTKIVRMSHLLKELGVSVLINDYEPFSAIAAQRMGIPVFQFNHPGIVILSMSMAFDALSVKIAAYFMMPAFDKRIFCSFYNGDVGPMIRRELLHAQVYCGDYFLLNLKKEYRKPVLKRLHQMGLRNYRLFPNKHENYVTALTGCRAVISSAGHQTISESIFLKKPIFVIPQRGQYEQRLNAQMLLASGWGSYGSINKLKHKLRHFINELDSFPRKPKSFIRFNFHDESERIITKVRHFISKNTPHRKALLWQTIFPEDEETEAIHNLWGVLPRKTEERIQQREKQLIRFFTRPH